MGDGPSTCRAVSAGAAGTVSGAAADAGTPPGEEACTPARFDVDGYALLSCSPMVNAETISRLFAENRPSLFLRLLEQVQEQGYGIRVGAAGIQEWQARQGAYHPLATRALEQLPSNLANELSKERDMKTQLYVERVGYRDPLDEVRFQATAALSLPPDVNKHKAFSVTPLVVAFRQDHSDPGRIIVEITDWMRQGRVVWGKGYDTRNFRDREVSYESLDKDKLLRRIADDVKPVLAAYQPPALSDVTGILQGGLSEVEFYAPPLVEVVEQGAGMCMAPIVFDELSLHVNTIETGAARAQDLFGSNPRKVRGIGVALDVPRVPYQANVRGQLYRARWSRSERADGERREEIDDRYGNHLEVWRSADGQVAELQADFAPLFVPKVHQDGDPIYGPVRWDVSSLKLPASEPCIGIQIVYADAVFGRGNYPLFSLTQAESAKRLEPHLQALGEVLAKTEESFGSTAGAIVQGIVADEDDIRNGRVHAQFPQYVFLTDELIEAFSGQEAAGRLEDVVRHEAIHSIDYRFGISDHKAVQAFFQTTSQDHPGFFQKINESHFIEKGFGGHAADNPKELLASFLNGILRDDWQQRVMLLPEGDRRVYAEALRVIGEAVAAAVPEGRQSPLAARLEVCRRFLRTP